MQMMVFLDILLLDLHYDGGREDIPSFGQGSSTEDAVARKYRVRRVLFEELDVIVVILWAKASLRDTDIENNISVQRNLYPSSFLVIVLFAEWTKLFPIYRTLRGDSQRRLGREETQTFRVKDVTTPWDEKQG